MPKRGYKWHLRNAVIYLCVLTLFFTTIAPASRSTASAAPASSAAAEVIPPKPPAYKETTYLGGGKNRIDYWDYKWIPPQYTWKLVKSGYYQFVRDTYYIGGWDTKYEWVPRYAYWTYKYVSDGFWKWVISGFWKWITSGFWKWVVDGFWKWITSGFWKWVSSGYYKWVDSGYWKTVSSGFWKWVSSSWWSWLFGWISSGFWSWVDTSYRTWVDTSYRAWVDTSYRTWVDTSHRTWVDTSSWRWIDTSHSTWVNTSSWKWVDTSSWRYVLETGGGYYKSVSFWNPKKYAIPYLTLKWIDTSKWQKVLVKKGYWEAYIVRSETVNGGVPGTEPGPGPGTGGEVITDYTKVEQHFNVDNNGSTPVCYGELELITLDTGVQVYGASDGCEDIEDPNGDLITDGMGGGDSFKDIVNAIWDKVETLAGWAKEFFLGMYDGLKSSWDGITALFKAETWEAMYQLAKDLYEYLFEDGMSYASFKENILPYWIALSTEFVTWWNEFKSGNGDQKARMAGEAVAVILIEAIGAKGAGTVLRIIRTVKKVTGGTATADEVIYALRNSDSSLKDDLISASDLDHLGYEGIGDIYNEVPSDLKYDVLYKAGVPCNCFTAGTKVLTKSGEKSIQDVQLGEYVLAKNPDTGEMAYKEVDMLFQRPEDEIWKVHVGDETISTSSEHPFWIKGKGWVVTKDLIVGDLFETSDGSHLSIDKIEVHHQPTTLYNFRVKDFHTYYVSNLKILTHNSSCPNYKSNVLGKRNATTTSGTNSARLADALESVGLERPTDKVRGITHWEAHHIVPAGEKYPSAESARAILDKYNIDVNSPTNGVWLPKNPRTALSKVEWSDSITSHNGRHIESYYIYVNQQLQDVIRRGGTNAQITSRLEEAINDIREELLTGKIILHSY